MRHFFEPRSVALVGVTRQTGPGAYNNLEMLLRYGYQGDVYLVHPKVPEILGRKTHTTVVDLPHVPDLAVISVGRDRVLPVFSQCVQKGIRRVIIISQGFADADEQGRQLQSQIVEMARSTGTRVIGPNTMGILNAFAGFSSAFVDIPKPAAPSPLTLVAQTGALQVAYDYFDGKVGKAADLGNACDVDFADILGYLETDPQTRVVAIHMEGITRGRRFLQNAARVARKKPVVVLKTGRSAAGARAAQSHTGALAGEDELFDAAFARAGLVRVRNMIELRAACLSLVTFRPMNGPRLGVVTASGACGIIAADLCEDYGLELAPLSDGLRAKLEDPAIGWHRLRNPVDIWPLGMKAGSFTDVFKNAVGLLLRAEAVDGILGIAPAMSSPLHSDLDVARTIREIQAETGPHKPTALCLYGSGVPEQYRELSPMADVACFESIEEAVMGLAATWQWESRRRRQPEDPDLLEAAAESRPAESVALPAGEVLVGEAVFSLLEQFQIPVAPGRLARDEESAVACARELGYPVVLKIISPEWLHKSDQGGVCVGVSTEADLRSSYAHLTGLFRNRTPSGLLEGILVQKQVEGTEILMGIKNDEQFGPVLMVGAGGIYTEIFKDVARWLLPIQRGEAQELLCSLRIYPILKGMRGRQPVDLSALVDTLLAVSRLALACPDIAELDLNPVLAGPYGCWCADCRIIPRPDSSAAHTRRHR
jgi:acetyltransferase